MPHHLMKLPDQTGLLSLDSQLLENMDESKFVVSTLDENQRFKHAIIGNRQIASHNESKPSNVFEYSQSPMTLPTREALVVAKNPRANVKSQFEKLGQAQHLGQASDLSYHTHGPPKSQNQQVLSLPDNASRYKNAELSQRSKQSEAISSANLKAQEGAGTAAELEDKFRRHRFDSSTLILMLFVFLSIVQIVEQIMMRFSCSKFSAASQATLSTPEWLANVDSRSFNFYDSSIQCDSDPLSLYTTSQFYFSAAFVVAWIAIVPLPVLTRAGRELIIEYFGILSKVALLVIVKFVVHLSQFYAWVSGAFVITFQLVIFLALRNNQTLEEGQKLLKLYELNRLDMCLHLVLCSTAYIGLCQALLEKDLNENIMHLLFTIMLVLNVLYLVLWLYKVSRLSLKHLQRSSQYAHIYLFLTCSCFKSHPPSPQKTQEEMEKKQELDQAKEEELRKIDMMIQHLGEVQRQIIKENKEALDNESATSKLKQQHQRLMDEMASINIMSSKSHISDEEASV